MRLLLLLLIACAYQVPFDPEGDPAPLNVISGALVYGGEGAPGHTVVLVYDAQDPPPPAGTGRPLTFTTVGAEAWSLGPSEGLRSAPWSVPYLADTDQTNGLANGYLVSAVMDADENFHPLLPGLAGPTYGDWLGAHIHDLTDPRPAPIFVDRGQHLSGISVTLGSRAPLQRPVFQVEEGELSRQQGTEALDPTRMQRFQIEASAAHTTYAPGLHLALDGPCSATCDPSLSPVCPCDPGHDPSETALWTWFVDADGDGVHDPHPQPLQAAAGMKDTWPRVYLQWMDPDPSTFLWEGREREVRWVAESAPLALELAALGPEALAPGDPFEPFPARALQVTWIPVFRHYHPEGSTGIDPASGPFDLYDLRCQEDDSGALPPSLPHCQASGPVPPEQIPAGAWQVTLISHTGQTWTVPNEIGDPALAMALGLPELVSDDPGFEVRTQGQALILK